jgi:hypothetical protein
MKRWIPGVALVCAMTGAGALVGMALGLRFWPLFLALALGGLAVVAWLTHGRIRSRAAATRRPRGRRTKRSDEEYDLETDTSTDEQRWLM